MKVGSNLQDKGMSGQELHGVAEKFVFKIKSPCQQIGAEIILRKVSRAMIEW